MKLCNTFFGLWLKPSNVKLTHFPFSTCIANIANTEMCFRGAVTNPQVFCGSTFLRKSLQNSPTLLLRPDCAPSWTEREKGWKVVLVWEGNLGKVDQSAARCCLSPHRAQKVELQNIWKRTNLKNDIIRNTVDLAPHFFQSIKVNVNTHCTQTVSWFISSVVISWKKQNKANQFQKFSKAKLKSLWYKYFMQRLL